MKKMIVALLAVVVVLSGTPALAAVYTDLPGDNWAAASVSQAGEYGLMNGQGEGLFGFGNQSRICYHIMQYVPLEFDQTCCRFF
ncbi:MAG: hypothetical protein RR332_03005 [Clostridiales bacterium]